MFKKIALCVLMIAGMVPAFGAEEKKMDDRLNTKQKRIVPIAAFTACGNMEKLKEALHRGLNAGLTVNEIKEILVQMYAYTGFPRSLNGLNAFMEVVKAREAKGIKDIDGPEASSMPADKSSIELGTEVQTYLVGRPVTGELFTFAPAIDQFLKSHLFGDIFGRDNLGYKNREIATISALAAMEGVNSQLGSHFNVGLNAGLTVNELRGIIAALGEEVDTKAADNAAIVLNSVLESRK